MHAALIILKKRTKRTQNSTTDFGFQRKQLTFATNNRQNN